MSAPKMHQRRPSLWEKFVAAIPFLSGLSKDLMQRTLEELAGADAVDCGTCSYYITEDQTEEWRAAVAVRSGRAAWIRHDQAFDGSNGYGPHVRYLAQASVYVPSDGPGCNVPSYFVFYQRHLRFGGRHREVVSFNAAVCNFYDYYREGESEPHISIACG